MRQIRRRVVIAILIAGFGMESMSGVDAQPRGAENDRHEGVPRSAASTPAKGERSAGQIGAPDKVASIIQNMVAVVAQGAKPGAAESLANLSNSLVHVSPAGELHVYIVLHAYRREHVAHLEGLGLRVELVLEEFALVQGWAPAIAIDALSRPSFVKYIRPPGYPMRQASGAVTTQGDSVLRADTARGALGLTGLGVKVGVLSDGVSHRSAVSESGDLPASVQVLKAGSGDEGTAMLEIVHDLAPGASLAFYAPSTSADMVAGINALAAAGARVVVDDLLFFDEPKFEDGMIAQTARSFSGTGVYVTSAGNLADIHYHAPYVGLDASLTSGGRTYSRFHNYAASGMDVGNTFTLPAFCSVQVELQWSNRFGAASDDFDLFIARSSDGLILAASRDPQTGSQDPRERLIYTSGSSAVTIYIAIAEFALVSDPASILLDYVVVFSCGNPPGGLQYVVAAESIRGHATVPEVVSVAAVRASAPTAIQPYSSQGPATMRFPSSEIRSVPTVAAADCVSTRVGQLGFFQSTFCGTSAAAPHVAAVAALLLEGSPGLSPDQVRTVLKSTAVDLGSAGFDFAFGAGRVDAMAAAQAAPLAPATATLAGAAVLPASRAGRVPSPSTGCLPTPLPATPVPPVVSRDVVWGFSGTDRMRFDVWRQPCQDGSGSYPLIRVTPQSVGPFLCYIEFTIVQEGGEFDTWLTPSASSTSGFCGDLAAATTFVLRPDPLDADYDLSKPFTLIFDGRATTYSMAVPGEPSAGSVLTAFATIIAAAGAGPAIGCGIIPATSVPAAFFYQTTDPATNVPIGVPNTPVDIPAGEIRTFVIGFEPVTPFAPLNVQLAFDCANTRPATIVAGLNTLLLSVAATPVADIVALAATVANDGIVSIPGPLGTGVFAVATVNVGAAASITVSADTSGSTAAARAGEAVLPVALTICQTNPATSVCLAPPRATVTTQINPGETPTYAIFVKGNGAVAFDPATNRVTVRFKDGSGTIRGATSVAVRTQ